MAAAASEQLIIEDDVYREVSYDYPIAFAMEPGATDSGYGWDRSPKSLAPGVAGLANAGRIAAFDRQRVLDTAAAWTTSPR